MLQSELQIVVRVLIVLPQGVRVLIVLPQGVTNCFTSINSIDSIVTICSKKPVHYFPIQLKYRTKIILNKFTSTNYWILLNIAECYWILLDVTEYSTQRITEYSVNESFTDSADSQWIYKKYTVTAFQ